MNKKKKSQIAIIGSGIGGLSLGYYLLKDHSDIEISFFEKEQKLGGLAMTTDIEGKKLEKFYHHIFTTDTDIISLIEELGLSSHLHWYADNKATYYKKKLYDFTTTTDILRFSPIPLIDRLRMGAVLFYVMKKKNWKSLEKYTADEWMPKYIGQKAYEVLWKSLLYAKFQNRYKDITMSWLWSRIATRGNSNGKLGYMDNSFEELIEAIAQYVQNHGAHIHTAVRIQKVKKEGKQVSVDYEEKGKEYTEIFDKVIITAPPKVYTSFLEGLPASYVKNVTSIDYISAQTLIITLKHRLTNYYWISVADTDEPALVVVEQSNLIDQYNKKHVIYVGNYLQNDSEVLQMDEEALKKRYYPFLKRLNKHFKQSWVEKIEICRAPFAQPIVDVSYHTHIPEFASPVKNVYILTMSQVYPEDRGMNFAIKNAKILSKDIM